MKKYALFLLAAVILGQGCAKPVIVPAEPPQPAAPAPEPAQPVTQPDSVPSQSSDTTSTVNIPNRANLSFPGVLPASETSNKLIRIKTAKGEIVFELLPSEGTNAASNFVYLVKNRFYDGLKFHRREEGFVIQGGDPHTAEPESPSNLYGTGDPGYRFADDPVKLPYNRGIVAMANSGPNTNGSQFFIMLGDSGLSPNYSIFGRVVQGMDVVDQIQVGDMMTSVTIEDKK